MKEKKRQLRENAIKLGIEVSKFFFGTIIITTELRMRITLSLVRTIAQYSVTLGTRIHTGESILVNTRGSIQRWFSNPPLIKTFLSA